MKLNVPDEYVPLIVKGLEHYYAYTRAVNRDDSRYQRAADWFQGELARKSDSVQPDRALGRSQPRRRGSADAR